MTYSFLISRDHFDNIFGYWFGRMALEFGSKGATWEGKKEVPPLGRSDCGIPDAARHARACSSLAETGSKVSFIDEIFAYISAMTSLGSRDPQQPIAGKLLESEV